MLDRGKLVLIAADKCIHVNGGEGSHFWCHIMTSMVKIVPSVSVYFEIWWSFIQFFTTVLKCTGFYRFHVMTIMFIYTDDVPDHWKRRNLVTEWIK